MVILIINFFIYKFNNNDVEMRCLMMISCKQCHVRSALLMSVPHHSKRRRVGNFCWLFK